MRGRGRDMPVSVPNASRGAQGGGRGWTKALPENMRRREGGPCHGRPVDNRRVTWYGSVMSAACVLGSARLAAGDSRANPPRGPTESPPGRHPRWPGGDFAEARRVRSEGPPCAVFTPCADSSASVPGMFHVAPWNTRMTPCVLGAAVPGTGGASGTVGRATPPGCASIGLHWRAGRAARTLSGRRRASTSGGDGSTGNRAESAGPRNRRCTTPTTIGPSTSSGCAAPAICSSTRPDRHIHAVCPQ